MSTPVLYVLGGFLLYVLLLIAVKRHAGEQGYLGLQAGMSLAWWLGIDLVLIVTSFSLAAATYRMWVPTEGDLGELSPILAFLQGSGIEIADVLAASMTLLIFGLAHSLSLAAIWLRQSLTKSESQQSKYSESQQSTDKDPPLWLTTAGFLGILAATGYSLLAWEAPVIALRIAQMLGSDGFETATEDILAIRNIWTLLSQSWLLTALSLVWSIAILFNSHMTVKAKLAFDAALNFDAVLNHEKEEEETAEEPAASTATVRQAEIADALAAPQTATTPIPTVAQSAPVVSSTDNDTISSLLAQNEELASNNDLLQREVELRRTESVRSPLSLSNHKTAVAFSSGKAAYDHAAEAAPDQLTLTGSRD